MQWRHRAYFLVMIFIGAVIAVGAFPYTSKAPGVKSAKTLKGVFMVN